MRILAIDPFHGGSHRQYLNAVQRQSSHRWDIITGAAVHWKWRMRSSPLDMAGKVRRHLRDHGYPDALFCTDMLDLAAFRGLIRDAKILNLPTAVYFHENQWSYPVSPHAQPDHHFGYTNLLSALAADACWFNSQFHLDDFIEHSQDFVKRMPDGQAAHDFDQLRRRAEVIPPGFQPRAVERSARDRIGITIGWVSRWEHDKRPDQFYELLRQVEHTGTEFHLILLGARPRRKPQSLDQIEQRFGSRIIHNGFAETADQYWHQLAQIDVVVSTADHEFFGIAVCEAIAAGAVPLLPRRLGYPELAVDECLYRSIDDAVFRICEWADASRRSQLAEVSQQKLRPLAMEQTVAKLDQALERLVASTG